MEKSICTGPAKGRSGATIILAGDKAIKIGVNLSSQHAHCSLLFPLTPFVYDYIPLSSEPHCEDIYVMERLSEPDTLVDGWAVDTLKNMRRSLTAVWARSCRHVLDYGNWEQELTIWCGRQGFDIAPLMKEYGMEGLLRGAPYLIHGDPTLANVLVRVHGAVLDTRELVICDPIKPTGKIPSHYTVDLGKMLQSAIGWERQILDLEIDTPTAIAAVLYGEPHVQVCRSWFWCMVHLLRILPYVPIFQDDYMWAARRAQRIYKDLIAQKVDKCYMPLI